jgi:hypothetical protein
MECVYTCVNIGVGVTYGAGGMKGECGEGEKVVATGSREEEAWKGMGIARRERGGGMV